MRTNQDLERELQGLLSGPFSDMPLVNVITIRFGQKARRRFGSIKMKPDRKVSQITINGIFKLEEIPMEIIQATIAHELAHYAHGFCSPLPQKYKNPHQGGVIKIEMIARGLLHLYEFEKRWTKLNWSKVVASQLPTSLLRRHRPARRGPASHRHLGWIGQLRSTIRRLSA